VLYGNKFHVIPLVILFCLSNKVLVSYWGELWEESRLYGIIVTFVSFGVFLKKEKKEYVH